MNFKKFLSKEEKCDCVKFLILDIYNLLKVYP